MKRTRFDDDELAALGTQQWLDDLRTGGEVPEPSPLFWEHLSQRVSASVEAEPMRTSWWSAMWRPAMAAGGVIGIVALAVTVHGGRPQQTQASVPTTLDGTVATETADGLWRMIDALAPLMPADAAKEAGFTVTSTGTSAAIEQLTDAERRKLVRLLRTEIGLSE